MKINGTFFLPADESNWIISVASELGQPLVVPEAHWVADSQAVYVAWATLPGVYRYDDLAAAREKIRRSRHAFCWYADLASGELMMLEDDDPAPGNSD